MFLMQINLNKEKKEMQNTHQTIARGSETEFWLKLSKWNVYLHASKVCWNMIGRKALKDERMSEGATKNLVLWKVMLCIYI